MRNIILSFSLMLLPIMANAYDTEINGVFYNVNRSNKTATVTYESQIVSLGI